MVREVKWISVDRVRAGSSYKSSNLIEGVRPGCHFVKSWKSKKTGEEVTRVAKVEMQQRRYLGIVSCFEFM